MREIEEQAGWGTSGLRLRSTCSATASGSTWRVSRGNREAGRVVFTGGIARTLFVVRSGMQRSEHWDSWRGRNGGLGSVRRFRPTEPVKLLVIKTTKNVRLLVKQCILSSAKQARPGSR